MDSNSKSGNKSFWISAIVIALVFAGGIYVGSSGKLNAVGVGDVSSSAPENANLSPFFTAWKLLEENSVYSSTDEDVTSEEKVYGAIEGLASSYGDPYTVFLPPKEKEFFESQVRGDFEGVGMEIGLRDDILTVVAPLKNTPAYRAGILSGDRIIEIDGESTAGITVEEAVGFIRGEKGTAVALTLVRDNSSPFEVSVVRDTILLPTLETELRSDGVFVISLYGFNAQAPQQFRDAVREFAESGTDKMIIDLRGNPGGYLEVAVDIASWFLPVGKMIVSEDYGVDSNDKAHRSRGYNVFTDQLKLAVLIDQGSASASEILAGALKEHGKATLIGQTSFGKGSVQQLFDVTPDSSIKITIARWLTPNGNSISDGGVKPDIEVEYTEEDREAGLDPQLERAAKFLTEGN